MSNTISINSIISAKDFLPWVQLSWGSEKCQMTPAEAKAHAYSILEAAEAATSDSIMVGFLADKVGLKDVDIASVLRDFRKHRDAGPKARLSDGSHRHGK